MYALGCTLYHFLTGKTPFGGESIVELITNKEKGKFTPAHRLNAGVPERLSLMVDKAMASDAKNRYQSCAEFVSDLEVLGMASEALSFIDEEHRTIVRRKGGGASARTVSGGPHPRGRCRPTSLRPAPRSRPGRAPAAKPDSQWFVKYVGSKGQVQVGKMSAAQVLQAIKSDKLNERSQACLKSKGPFLPLIQIPVFEAEARKMVTRQRASARDSNLESQYKKLARQHDRRKIWRFFGRLVSGTMGYIGLMMWLATIVVVLVILYYLVPFLFDLLAHQIGIGPPPE